MRDWKEDSHATHYNDLSDRHIRSESALTNGEKVLMTGLIIFFAVIILDSYFNYL